jgi:hypothetical protein
MVLGLASLPLAGNAALLCRDNSSHLGRQALACLKRLGLWLFIGAVSLACSIVDVVR